MRLLYLRNMDILEGEVDDLCVEHFNIETLELFNFVYLRSVVYIIYIYFLEIDWK